MGYSKLASIAGVGAVTLGLLSIGASVANADQGQAQLQGPPAAQQCPPPVGDQGQPPQGQPPQGQPPQGEPPGQPPQCPSSAQ